MIENRPLARSSGERLAAGMAAFTLTNRLDGTVFRATGYRPVDINQMLPGMGARDEPVVLRWDFELFSPAHKEHFSIGLDLVLDEVADFHPVGEGQLPSAPQRATKHRSIWIALEHPPVIFGFRTRGEAMPLSVVEVPEPAVLVVRPDAEAPRLFADEVGVGLD